MKRVLILALVFTVAAPMALALDREHVPGDLILKLVEVPADLQTALAEGDSRPATGLAGLDRILVRQEALSIEYLLPRVQRGELLAEDPEGLERLMVVKLPERTDILKLAEQVSRIDGVEYATDNPIFHGFLTPNDPMFSDQYGLHNTGQTGGTSGADVNAPEAWDITTGGSGVLVAVLDTGADFGHPDLAANLVAGWDCVNEDSDPSDDHGHGTHVSGTIAAVSNNSTGVAGVSWSAQVLAIKIFNSGNWGTGDDLVQGFDVARTWGGVDVINMSGGATGTFQPLQDAVDACYNAGIVMCCATGNSGSSVPAIPAAYWNTIAVGATDHTDTRWTGSNYGNHMDLVAPGVDILSTAWNGGSPDYQWWTGTSMACPHVAGAAALILSVYPDMTPSGMKSLLRASADDLGTTGWDQYYGKGRLNISAAFAARTVPSAGPVGLVLLMLGMGIAIRRRR